MYGKIDKRIYFCLSRIQRELLILLVLHADEDGVVDVAGVAIQSYLGISKEEYEEAKLFLLDADISRFCSAAGIIFVPMYTTGRFVIIWDFKRLPQSRWAKIRNDVFKRDDYTCNYCGSRGKSLECDHVVPVSRGGSHDLDNLVTACKTCNQSKRDKLLSEWRPEVYGG